MNTDFSLSQPPALDETAAPATPPDSMEALLLRLRQRGVQLQAEGAQLRISAPKGALDDDLRAALSAGKSEILRLLQSQERRSALPQIQPQPAQRHEPFPLTDVQHAYWMGRQPFVELGGFSTHCYFEFQRAGLDIERLETALQALILRHDMLRAVINEDGTQRVLPEVPPYRIECLDLREQGEAQAEAALLAQREQLSHKRGPVDQWPLFAIRAARLPGEQLRLFVSLDMLIIDASSMFLFFQEWQQAYEDPQRLAPAQAFSYRDYALFEQTLHEQPEFQRARDYWTARLDSLPPAPGLPLARQPHELTEVRFERREQRIAAADWARLKPLAAQHGATPTVLLMTAFAEALRPWSATPDFSLNVTLFHRFPVHPEVDQLIGDFTATSLLAARAQAGDSFADRLQRLQAQLAEDLDHRAYSGMRVLRDRARHLGHAPGAAMPVVFTSTLALDGRQSTTGGLSFFGDIVHGVSQTPQVWMDHQMAEFDGELRLFLDAIEDLFPVGLLDDCFGAYAQLLRTLAADPAAWAQRPLPATLPARHLPLLAQLNATEDPAIGHGLLQDGLIIQARRQPEALAVIAADGQLSYGRLAREAQVLAEALQALGAGRELPIAVMMDKGCEQVLAVYGVLMAGAAYLPIDPRLPAERRRHLLSASGARLLLTQAAHHPGQDLTPGLRVLCLGDEALAAPAIAPPPAATRPGDLAYVLFTSGSTGAPKGVMIEHAQAVNTLQDINRRMQVGPRDRVLALSALHFDLSVYDLFGVIAAGGCLVMPDPARLHDAQHWAELVQAHRVSLWNSVPQLLQHFVEHLEHLQAQGEPLPGGLRQAILSGDWIPVGLPDRARRVCPDLQLLASGGPTETAIWCTQYPIGKVDPAWSSIPYGRPLANQRMWVMDELLQERPVGVTGEICIGGACVGRGYLGDEAQTAQRFLRHPRTGERLYRSGDLGRVTAEGQIEFLGRQDHQVKLNGLRIELGEINACLLRQPGIRQAWTGVRSEGAQKQLVSLLVLDPDDAAAATRLTDGSLRQSLAAWLPDYMLPQRFQRLEALPLSANGKVDAAQLQALLQAQQAEGAAPAAQTDAAAQALQEQLLPLWRSLLGRQDLTPAQSFFDVGGDSLLALRLLSRVREQLGLAPALQGRLMQCFFQQPRLADFAAALARLQQDPPAQGADELPLIEPASAPTGEDFPAADVQLAFLMGDGEDLEFHVRTHHYVEVEMPAFDPARYEQALQRELQRQAANIVVATPELRLRPVQDLTPLPLSLDDCRALDAAACEARLLATRARMERQTLPVHRWPWMDVHATLLPGGHARLHINCNAVFWDGFGTQQFFANVERCYREPGLVLPPLTLTLRDCVLALERLEQGPQGERSRRYWMERLPGMPAAPALPLKPRLNRRQRSMMKRREMDLSAAQWQALRQHCDARGLRPEAGLFAAYAQILSFWSGSRHFLLNNMVSHRLPMHEQIFEIVGNFSALYPLEVDWREGGGFAERCRRLDQRMQQDAQHLHCSGVQVLQAYNRVHGQAGRAACPFVVGNGLAMKPFTRSLHGCLETPQVLLDNQFFGLEDGGIWITWDVFEDVFPAGQVDAMWQAYARLLDQLAHDDAAWDSEGFDLLDEAARALRRAYNDSAAPRPEGRLLQDGLLEQARQQGDALALVAEGQRLSYAQLAAQALALAGQLQARGRAAAPRPLAGDRRAGHPGGRRRLCAHGPAVAGAAPAAAARQHRRAPGPVPGRARCPRAAGPALPRRRPASFWPRLAAARRQRDAARLHHLHLGLHRRAQGRDDRPPRRAQHHRRHQPPLRREAGGRALRRVLAVLRPLGLRPLRQHPGRRPSGAAGRGHRRGPFGLAAPDAGRGRDRVELGTRADAAAGGRRAGGRRAAAAAAPGDAQRGLDPGDPARPGPPHRAQCPGGEPGRRHGGLDLVHRLPHRQCAGGLAQHPLRPPPGQPALACAGRGRPRAARRRHRPAAHRRHRAGPGLLGGRGAHRRRLHPPPAQRRAALPHGRPRPPAARGPDRVPGPRRLPGQDPGLPHRDRRDRARAAGPPRRARRGGHRGRQPGGQAAAGLRHRRRGPGPGGRAGACRRPPAGLYGAQPPAAPGPAAADRQWQGGP